MPRMALAGVTFPADVESFADCPETPEYLEAAFEPFDRFLAGSEDERAVVTEVMSEEDTGTARDDIASESDDIIE